MFLSTPDLDRTGYQTNWGQDLVVSERCGVGDRTPWSSVPASDVLPIDRIPGGKLGLCVCLSMWSSPSTETASRGVLNKRMLSLPHCGTRPVWW